MTASTFSDQTTQVGIHQAFMRGRHPLRLVAATTCHGIAGTLFPNMDTNGNVARHGYYLGGGSPLMGGSPFPTEIYQSYWGQILIGQATTLLHEAYHAHGYWASKSGV